MSYYDNIRHFVVETFKLNKNCYEVNKQNGMLKISIMLELVMYKEVWYTWCISTNIYINPNTVLFVQKYVFQILWSIHFCWILNWIKAWTILFLNIFFLGGEGWGALRFKDKNDLASILLKKTNLAYLVTKIFYSDIIFK